MRAALPTRLFVIATLWAVPAFAQSPAPSTAPATQPAAPTSYWELARGSDPADLKIYCDINAALPAPKPDEDRVVFIGDSITENWQRTFAANFPNKPNYIGRGRTSETTFQMLIRFKPDIINLKPKVVVIMAGVNDVAGNTGAVSDENIHNNFVSMFDIAKANNVKVVLVSTLPATRFFWQPGIQGASQRVKQLVQWEKQYAEKNGLYFVNAFDRFKDENDGMPQTYSGDTVHPNAVGYQILSAMVEQQIELALKGAPTDTPTPPIAIPTVSPATAPSTRPTTTAGRGGRGGRGGFGRGGPTSAPTPTVLADLGMPIQAGALPIRAQGRGAGLAYVPGTALAKPIIGPDGRGPTDTYWIVAILADPADLKVYRDANAKVGEAKSGDHRVVFLGDSITEKWQQTFDTSFPGKSDYIGRGISAETSMQMLVRFRPDVINLGANVVVLQAGIGDIAGNTGDVPDATIHDNLSAIADLAKTNHIKLVCISTLPASKIFWQPAIDPTQHVAELVVWQKDFAAKSGIYFVDAYSALKDSTGGMDPKYSADGIHPNAEGFAVLSKLTQPQIEKAIKGVSPD